MDQNNQPPTVRSPGQPRAVILIDRPSEFDAKFDQFVASVGDFKIIAVNFKVDDVPDNGLRKSKAAKAARRRRNRRRLKQFDGTLRLNQDAASGFGDGANNHDDVSHPNNGDDDEENGEEDGGDENGGGSSGGDDDYELDEEELCEIVREKSYERGKIALISMSTLGGVSLLIRTCRFLRFPEKLSRMLEGKEYLKVGFGVQSDKSRVFEKCGFFVLNYLDPRRPLFAWKQFINSYHFERFGVYSVASHIFDCELQNIDAAACLSSMWCAQALHPYLRRAAARETQLTIDVYAEMCVQLLGRRPLRYSLTESCYQDPEFYIELLEVAQGHINNGFDMKDFGMKVFATPAVQQRYLYKIVNRKQSASVSSQRPITISDKVPNNFADRVRLRRSKSTVDELWTSGILFAAFDSSLFKGCHLREGYNAPLALTRIIDNTTWRMTVEVMWKGGGNGNTALLTSAYLDPAVGYHKRQSNEEEMPDENEYPELQDPSGAPFSVPAVENFTEYYPAPVQEYEIDAAATNGVEVSFNEQFSVQATLGSTSHDDINDSFGMSGPRFSPVPADGTMWPKQSLVAGGRGRGRWSVDSDAPNAVSSEYSYEWSAPLLPGKGRGRVQTSSLGWSGASFGRSRGDRMHGADTIVPGAQFIGSNAMVNDAQYDQQGYPADATQSFGIPHPRVFGKGRGRRFEHDGEF